MKFVKYSIFLLLLLSVTGAFAYRPKRTNTFSSYKDRVNEIGYSINASYLQYQQALSPQLYLHYTHYFTNYFGVGIGYGSIYDKYFHNTFNGEVTFRFYEKMLLTIKPGVTMKNSAGNYKWLYSVSANYSYEIPISEQIHIGPTLEIGMIQDDVNYQLGFHMGFAF